MPTLLYIHGFLSSPHSYKAQQTQKWLAYHKPDWLFECPFLSSKPSEALPELDAIVSNREDDDWYVIGSSLGGFWASYITEHYGFKSVLINPAVKPCERFASLVGEPLKHYHTQQEYILDAQDIEVLRSADSDVLKNTDLYWLLVQTEDETLDYRMAVEKFMGCRQTVEQGGSHAFEGFENWLPEFIDFFED